MVQEEQNRLIINDVLKLSADISALYLSKKFSDVFLVAEEEKLPAHKVILAARSKFFETLLFGDDEQLLSIVSVESTHIATDLEILGLASQYSLEDLKAPLISKIKKLIDAENVFTVLDMANLYNLQDLIKDCQLFLDTHAFKLKSTDGFNNLSQASMVNLLQRDTFVLPEIDIFNIAVKWRKSNTDLDDLVIQNVRFEWMTVAEIVSKVWPLKILSCETLMEAIAKIVNVKPKTSTCRVQARVDDDNLATVKYNSKVITGSTPENLLNGNRDPTKYCEHILGNKSGITIELGSNYMINSISMRLYDGDLRYYKYYIEMSTDGENWLKSIDYNLYPCRSDQNLYFEPIITKFIRIIGTHNTVTTGFHLIYFEAFYRLTVPRVIKNVVVPNSNVAALDKKAILLEGSDGNSIIDGAFANYTGNSRYTSHSIGSGSIVIQLAQPYVISSMKLRLWDGDSRFYKFYIETSTNKSNWEMAIDRRNKECKSWQYGTFSERVTVFIRITGTDNSVKNGFHCIYFESPSPAPVK